MTVVAVCAIAVVLFAVSGYTGYAITIAAVGLAAAVNLLPNHRPPGGGGNRHIGAAHEESDRDVR